MLSRDHYRDASLFHYPDCLRENGYAVLGEERFIDASPIEKMLFDNQLAAMTWAETLDFGVHFAALASPDGTLDVRPFGNADHRRVERDGRWTSNAAFCPDIVAWLEESGLNYGSVRILRKSNDIRDLRTIDQARTLYHRDTTNLYAEPGDAGWIVRLLIQISDDRQSLFLCRAAMDAPERQLPLGRGIQILFDADQLWHTIWHPSPTPRYALLVSLESSPALDAWVAASHPALAPGGRA